MFSLLYEMTNPQTHFILIFSIIFFFNCQQSVAIWCYNATLYQFFGDPQSYPSIPKTASIVTDCDECSVKNFIFFILILFLKIKSFPFFYENRK